jgi:hypothetical protein
VIIKPLMHIRKYWPSKIVNKMPGVLPNDPTQKHCDLCAKRDACWVYDYHNKSVISTREECEFNNKMHFFPRKDLKFFYF